MMRERWGGGGRAERETCEIERETWVGVGGWGQRGRHGWGERGRDRETWVGGEEREETWVGGGGEGAERKT